MRFKRIWQSQVAAKTSRVGSWTWLQSSHLFWDHKTAWLRDRDLGLVLLGWR